MNRVSLLLLLGVVASGLYLVKTSYEARRLFGQIEQAKGVAEQLKADRQRLEAQRRSDGTHLRVERDAREKLGMRFASPDVTMYVAEAGVPRAAASAVRP